MARPALRIDVTNQDRKTLRELLSGGVQQVRVILRAVALSKLAQGVSAPRISSVIPLTPQAIRKVGHRHDLRYAVSFRPRHYASLDIAPPPARWCYSTGWFRAAQCAPS